MLCDARLQRLIQQSFITSKSCLHPKVCRGTVLRNYAASTMAEPSSYDKSAVNEASWTTVLKSVKPESFSWGQHSTSTTGLSAHSHIEHEHLEMGPDSESQDDFRTLQEAATLLQLGHPVAIPTETVYGLAANALDSSAVKSIYAAKNRPADNPLIVHVSSLDMLKSLYPDGWELPEMYHDIVEAHWPGPLTILLPKSEKVAPEVLCGQPTMAVRMPAHPVARALISLSGLPLAAPSANSSGKPSPTSGLHVKQDLDGRIPMIIDGGDCHCGVESTVLDGLRQPPCVLRPGGVTYEQLQQFQSMEGLQVYKKHFVDAKLEAAPTTPGMKYRHYSPAAPVVLLDVSHCTAGVDEIREAAAQKVVSMVQQEIDSHRASHVSPDLGHSTDIPGSSRHASNDPKVSSRSQAASHDETNHDHSNGTQQDHAVHAVPHIIRIGVLRTSKGLGLHPGLSTREQSYTQPTNSAPPDHASMTASHVHVHVHEYVLGDITAPGVVARELFRALRLMDELGVHVIVAEGVLEAGEGLAVMNRLRKAASNTVLL